MNISFKKLTLLLIISFSFIQISQGQVLISLLLGDKLNSDKLEFGLDGGMAFTDINGLPSSSSVSAFHLGFYFDIKMEEHLYLHTGVIVKSTLGAHKIPTYPVGEQSLDELMSEGDIRRRLSYFNVPIYLKYKFDNRFFIEAGPQLGLLHGAKDEFFTDIKDEDDLVFTEDIRDSYKALDYGLAGGIGYRLMKGNGMNVGFRYYLGLADILKDNTNESLNNRAFYLYVGIPIGAGKVAKEE
ncbi:porin family protein [Echinicola sp. 20G]|uniref:porin family protein n=1 Tax=Echinicola sp. 20G TaxID=2781961 RepID=UPI0019109570|nr:porin family protein [Echinicola sp. 20G]